MLKQAPNLYKLDGLVKASTGPCQAKVEGRYVPARPLGFYSIGNRLRCAWLVFTGRADAVTWPGQ